MSHTRGPWYVTELETGFHVDGGHEVLYDLNGKATHHVTVVADVHHGRGDARLIAAAPDLLEAAEAMIAASTVSDVKAIFEAHARMTSAVAKARGES